MNDQTELLSQAQQRIALLNAQIAELEALKRGDLPAGMARMQHRMARQSQALDRLNRRVLSQRMRLRTINELGRDLTKEEYLAARDAHPLTDRIEDYVPVS